VSRPLKVQIVQRARELILDEQHWCRRHLAEVNGVTVSPICQRGEALRSRRINCGGLPTHPGPERGLSAWARSTASTLRPPPQSFTSIDVRGHAAVLALFDEVIAAD
jgi:hypothetical protein